MRGDEIEVNENLSASLRPDKFDIIDSAQLTLTL